MRESYDAIIIGAGIVGVSSAIHLQQKGLSVLLLDKKGIAEETSYGNAGIIESSYVLPFAPPHWPQIPKILFGSHPYARVNYPSGLKMLPWVASFYWQSRLSARKENGRLMRPLVENAAKEHEALLQGTDGLRYINDAGRVKLHRTKRSFQKAKIEREVVEHYAVPFQILSAYEFCELEPDIKPVFYKALRLTESKRYTNPAKAIQCMAEKFVGQGGSFKIEAVTDIRKNDEHWYVNDHKSRNVLICTGPWANETIKQLGYCFPIGMKRGYHKHFRTQAKISHTLVDADAGYLICPMEQGLRITTGAEFADLNAPSNPIQIQQVLVKAQELVKIGDAVDDTAWCGTRPCMADSLPVIGEDSNHKGLWFNFGHGHCGITAGPASGKLIAQMMVGEKTFCDPMPYSPCRF